MDCRHFDTSMRHWFRNAQFQPGLNFSVFSSPKQTIRGIWTIKLTELWHIVHFGGTSAHIIWTHFTMSILMWSTWDPVRPICRANNIDYCMIGGFSTIAWDMAALSFDISPQNTTSTMRAQMCRRSLNKSGSSGLNVIPNTPIVTLVPLKHHLRWYWAVIWWFIQGLLMLRHLFRGFG